MKIYYYAYSGHKYGLDRVKRAVALIKAFARADIEIELLLNDFRAGLVARELGVRESVTVETFLDIDAIATMDDIVFIDTPEDVTTKLKRYCDKFKYIFRIVDDCDIKPLYCEEIISLNGDDMISSTMIDSIYLADRDKEHRRLLFLGDADYSRDILSNLEFINESNIKLLLGSYFYVKYENELKKNISTIYESDMYSELISTSSQIITASRQTALEAITSNSDVVYMKRDDDTQCSLDELEKYGIKIINYFDKDELLIVRDEKRSANKRAKTIDNITKSIIIKYNL